ncbi:GNAT family N-acetyltransferase [Microbacterium esteraromaticum]|uniref:GNAT family N-acetyltransferase n=2 Tax=Microbacterium esteraromaticum TaxID=57043 RepID=A0A7D8AE99_9MICO|nr:GNAT family N-acetyltransferase [Microbacterium esteraromaticum]
MPFVVRPAALEDAARLEEIEAAADRLLIDLLDAEDWPAPDGATERLALPGVVLVSELQPGEVIGFAHLLELEGHAHLEQVSVLPRFGRRGAGRMLVEAILAEAARRGHRTVTLRTYADVPWNAPFYETCGFVETRPDTPFLTRLVDVERALGLPRHGRRLQMTARVGA